MPVFSNASRPARGWSWLAFHVSNWSSAAGASLTRNMKFRPLAASRIACMRCSAGSPRHTEASLPGCCKKTAAYPRAAQCLPR
ncbi:MAG: hypothetical protein BWZ10_03450 [candidate division BRC1 bacterium ADurb.BinA364]|nr:MAG: hypothetical protein BWZ10_03450 [candidate division BRC1 bacterium ADurb.BinA364]